MSFQGRPPSPQRRGSAPPAGGFPVPSLPAGYLEQGYFDTAGNIWPKLIIDWARKIAADLDAGGMQSTQLRKFFSEVRLIEGQLEAGKDFATLQSRILKLDVYAADALKKKNIPPLFKKFIEENLKYAHKSKEAFLKGFLPHFESIVGYFPKK